MKYVCIISLMLLSSCFLGIFDGTDNDKDLGFTVTDETGPTPVYGLIDPNDWKPFNDNISALPAFPNPTTSNVTIPIEGQVPGNMQLSIFVNGNLEETRNIKVSTKPSVFVDVSKFASIDSKARVVLEITDTQGHKMKTSGDVLLVKNLLNWWQSIHQKYSN